MQNSSFANNFYDEEFG